MSKALLPLRVLIVADDPLARGGLAALLANQPDCTVVGQLATADIIAALDVYRPDIVLWDCGWEPGLSLHASESKSETSRTCLERLVDLRDVGQPVVALLSDHMQAVAAWTAGVHCLLLRDVPVTHLVSALHAAVQGLVVLDATLAAALFPVHPVATASIVNPLTPRETEVLQLVAAGLPNKTIADRLRISEHTVKFHINAIMGKLGAQSRTEAVVRATQQGLILL
jgi:two-component system, NarL family, nitrate/nitrite response regulator NarL